MRANFAGRLYMDSKERPIEVSVIVTTYFHEKYIAQALDSIIMQETTFCFEILIGDDASQDKTPEIIKDYAARYPELIRPVLRNENLGATRNSKDLRSRARGRYLSTLEGDDFWLDPHKLQKQWEFLEKNTEYIGCCGKCVVVDKDSNPDYSVSPRFFRNVKILTLNEFLDSWCIAGQVGTLMYRNIYPSLRPGEDAILYEANRNVGDKTSALFLLSKGPIYCLNDVLSAYRYIREGGNNYFSRHYADPYRNYHMFLYPCRLETWMKNELGIRHYNGKNKEYRFCRFVEETVREPSIKRMRCLVDMISKSHQPVKYIGLLFKALIEIT